MVDYSKWDNLDVSDSDEEPQPTTQKTNTSNTTTKDSTTPASQALTTKQTHPDPPTQADDEADKPRLSPTLQEYANIHPTNYRASHEFLNNHPSLIDKSTNSDGILMKEAFLLALQLENTPEDETLHAKNKADGKNEERQSETEKNEIEEMVRQCVHQALLLQYCRLVSPDGKDQSAIGGFFMRLIMPEGYGGSASGKEQGGNEKEKEKEKGRQRELLMADVETRAKEIIELAKEARAEQLREHLKKMEK
ncbi:hypothetical protein V8F20_008854 [Naviculisporaceae sp. PSN 640]